MKFTQRFRNVYKLLMFLGAVSFFLILLPSCNKEKINFLFTELPAGTTRDLNNIYFLNDSIGYVCGGLRYDKGDILKTTDGGFTWTDQSTPDMSKALYGITFISEDTGYICGYDGKIFRTYNAGIVWEYFQSSWYIVIRDICFPGSGRGLACGGDGYQTGALFQTGDSGNSWSFDTTSIEWRRIFFFNDSEGLLAGYGTILRTTDGGENWSHTDARGDFFVSMDFLNERVGYAVGYTGSVLKTTTGGQSWETLRNANSLFQSPVYYNRVVFRNEYTGYIIGENGCFLKTENGGDNWQQIENAPDFDWRGIALTNEGGFICGTEGKIFRFID